MRVRGLEMLLFRKILRTYLMDDPQRTQSLIMLPTVPKIIQALMNYIIT